LNKAYRSVISAGDDERRDLFLTAARRMGTAAQNVEKDFWVCWTLDVLFHGLPAGGPRLLFKGGTSLSKAFGLIDRFSEDIDVTIFRQDIGQEATIEELEILSGKKRRRRLDAIKAACQEFIGGPLRERFSAVLGEEMHAVGVQADRYRIEPDPDDEDQQSLLLWYPTVVAEPSGYIRSAVKIESGAKSALDPHVSATVKPYVDDDLADIDLAIAGITTVEAERTFWDKVIILHGLRRWYDNRGELRRGGQRVSRHYYDVFRLLKSEPGRRAMDNTLLAVDCARHARMFFNSGDLDLDHAVAGSFSLQPVNGMIDALRRDYEAMAGMVFGELPSFDDVLVSIAELEARLNAADHSD
jgi:hypothetical protein